MVWDGSVAGFSQLPDGRRWAAKVNHFKLNRHGGQQPPVTFESAIPSPSVHLPKALHVFPWLPHLVENCLGSTWIEHLRTTASGGKDCSWELLATCSWRLQPNTALWEGQVHFPQGSTDALGSRRDCKGTGAFPVLYRWHSSRTFVTNSSR